MAIKVKLQYAFRLRWEVEVTMRCNITTFVTFILTLVSFFNLNLAQSDIVVHTQVGPIRGHSTQENSNHYRFLGIPYAESPVGHLRLKDPVAKKPWTDIYNATFFGNQCIQYGETGAGIIGEEDCLFINVFIPRLPNVAATLPVMVWVHGGGFMFGNGNLNPFHLLNKEVIVVSMNYRLGLMGFMNLNNTVVSGNQGLKDQLLALKWVNNNIEAFGGNKDEVTFFGQSAGGMSIGFHQLSPLGNGLYKRVIMMAGAPLTMNGLIRSGRCIEDSHRFVIDYQCNEKCDTLKCLQSLPAHEYATIHLIPPDLNAELLAELVGNEMYLCAPSLDPNAVEPFLPKLPLEILKNKEYKDMPIMTGVVENDGALFSTLYWQQMAELETNWTAHGFRFLTWESSVNRRIPQDEDKVNAIKEYYFREKEFSQTNKVEMLNLIDDMVFIVPTIVALKYQVANQTNPIYYYEVNHKPSISFSTFYGKATNSHMVDFGVAHVDDTQYILKYSFSGIVTSEDMAVVEYMSNMFTDFAKSGNPGYNWTPYESTGYTFMNINATLSVVTQSQNFIDRMNFWQTIHWDEMESEK